MTKWKIFSDDGFCKKNFPHFWLISFHIFGPYHFIKLHKKKLQKANIPGKTYHPLSVTGHQIPHRTVTNRAPLTRQDPLPDDAVLVAEDPVAAGELVVELVVGVAEVDEAELP